jgi:predicted dehydrogenase
MFRASSAFSRQRLRVSRRDSVLQSGFCWRSNYAERATFAELQKGTAGKITTYYGTYLAGTPWVKPRKEGWTDLEWQLRNWLYFTWLSGDHIVEQAIHTVDKMSWAFGDVAPVQAVAMGAASSASSQEYGHIWDHFAICYDYPDGAKGFVFCRQQAGTVQRERRSHHRHQGILQDQRFRQSASNHG